MELSLDEKRVDWLHLKDEVTETFYIRKPMKSELKYLYQHSEPPFGWTGQIYNWFRFLQGLRPIGREDPKYLTLGRLFEHYVKDTLEEFYDLDTMEMKPQYSYLEELYDIVREEK